MKKKAIISLAIVGLGLLGGCNSAPPKPDPSDPNLKINASKNDPQLGYSGNPEGKKPDSK